MDVAERLRQLDFGRRVAEEEKDQLAAYFVETDQWRRIFGGEVDVVYGAKGAGKSALYSILLSRRDELFDRRILIESAEKPQGTPAFSGLVADPPTSEEEFVGLWKLYILTLVAKVVDEYGIHNDASEALVKVLADAGLAPQTRSLSALVKAALDYVRRALAPKALESEVQLDPVSGSPTVLRARIIFREPSDAERAIGTVSIDDALDLAQSALTAEAYGVWLLFDRLDVAFAGSPELERNALRALFKVYLDLLTYDALSPKIFLRTDIWRSITAQGFREASHITRSVTIDWDPASLLNLVVKRMLQNGALLEVQRVTAEDVVRTFDRQEAFFYGVFPQQVDIGPRKANTFNWMTARTRDGSGRTAPRELIHLLSSAREVQIQHIELGQRSPEGGLLFTPQAIKEALPEVSRVRVNQTLYSEYSDLKTYVEALAGGKTNHSLETLAAAWDLTEDEARDVAGQLVDVGFFEPRGNRQSPTYWIPFLYRPALDLVQGTAEE